MQPPPNRWRGTFVPSAGSRRQDEPLHAPKAFACQACRGPLQPRLPLPQCLPAPCPPPSATRCHAVLLHAGGGVQRRSLYVLGCRLLPSQQWYQRWYRQVDCLWHALRT